MDADQVLRLLPPWELVGGVLAGVAALITALLSGAKVAEELRILRHQSAKTAEDTAAVLKQQHTNGGSTMRDDVRRVLALSKRNAESIERVHKAQDRQDAELARINNSMAAMSERINVDIQHCVNHLADLTERTRELERRSKNS